MPVFLKDRIMFLQHTGNAGKPEAEVLCDQMQIYFETSFAESDKPVAVFHDTSNLIAASESYARVFGERFHEFDRNKVVLVGWIPQARFRILARFGAMLTIFEMKIYKNVIDCYDYLVSKGFQPDPKDFDLT